MAEIVGRHFLTMGSSGRQLSLSMQKQLGVQLAAREPLSIDDVSALDILSGSVVTKMMAEIVGRHFLTLGSSGSLNLSTKLSS